MVSLRTNGRTPGRTVPVIRLEDDADLRVWKAPTCASTTVLLCAIDEAATICNRGGSNFT